MPEELRVGIIGLDAERGWAQEAHAPAVQATAGLQLTAVAGRSSARARAAADRFGAEKAYGDAEELIVDPEIDIVTVAVPVPAHRELISAALRAGKHVLTEWPVGRGTAETTELATLASTSGVRTAVGLQARMNPAARRASHLVRSGSIGRVLRATAYSTTAAFGRAVAGRDLSLELPETGMNLTTIQAAHTVDFALQLVGPLEHLQALSTIQFPELIVDGGPTTAERRVPDHLLIQGRLTSGGALSLQVAGGRPADDTPFWMEIVGEEGTLRLAGGAPRGFQSGTLTLHRDREPVKIDDPSLPRLPEAAVNVAGLYRALRDDIHRGSSSGPSFDDAAALSRLVDAYLAAADTGGTVHLVSHD